MNRAPLPLGIVACLTVGLLATEHDRALSAMAAVDQAAQLTSRVAFTWSHGSVERFDTPAGNLARSGVPTLNRPDARNLKEQLRAEWPGTSHRAAASLSDCGALAMLAADEKVLLSDDFSTLKPGWRALTDYMSVADKKLHVQLKPGQTLQSNYWDARFGDADIRIQLSASQSDEDQEAGLIFWGIGSDDYYAASVQPDGGFYVVRRTHGKYLTVASLEIRDEVKKGLDQTNELRVVTSGSRATVYVNEQRVTEFRGFPPTGGGMVGVRVSSGKGPSNWAFANLRVTPGLPAPAAPTGSRDESLLFADDFSVRDPSWGVVDKTAAIGNGKLIIKPPLDEARTQIYRGRFFEDADIRVKVAQLQGATASPAGLIFWGADSRNYHGLFVQPDGTAKIAIKTDNQWTIGEKKSNWKAINTGLSAVNELRVVTRGNVATAYVNGQELGKATLSQSPGLRLVGLAAESDSAIYTWEFSDFVVRKPATVEPDSPPPAAGLLLSDDFSTLKPGWNALTDYMSVADKKLHIGLEPEVTLQSLYADARFGDADIRIRITASQDDQDQSGGLVFWGINSKNYYAAAIQPDGGLYVIRQTRGNNWPVVSLRILDEVRKGAGQTNELRVVTSGSRATVYVNDKKVTEFRGFPPDGGGKVGVRVHTGEEPGTWAFADLRVAPGPPAPAAPPGPRDESLLFADDFPELDPSWGYADDSKSVANGKLLVRVPAGSGRIYVNNAAVYDDVDLSIKVVAPAGFVEQDVGLIFWAGKVDHYCVFVVKPNGEVFATTREGKDFKRTHTLVSKTKWLRTGPGEVNEIRVVTQGKTALLYVNGRYAHSYQGPPPEGGSRVGIYSGSGTAKDTSVFEFSEFRVRTPLVMSRANADRTDGLLMTDDFRTLIDDWGVSSDAISVRDNRYLLTGVANNGRTKLYDGGTFKDADVSVKLSQTAGQAGPPAGIVFWGADYKNYYVALIRSTGEFSMHQCKDGSFSQLAPRRVVEEVMKGVGQVNTLRVITKGNKFTVQINGKEVAALESADHPESGKIGFHAASGAEAHPWAFSNLVVRKSE